MSSNIVEISKKAYANALAKGFHSNEDGTLKERNMGESIALIHSEASEALEEIRKNPDPFHRYLREKDGKPEGFLVELADIIIRIGDLVGSFEGEGELAKAIYEKMEFNKTRPHMHGKGF